MIKCMRPLQSARNQASLETPLKAEELLSAHFNLAVLEDQTSRHTNPDAEKSPGQHPERGTFNLSTRRPDLYQDSESLR